MTITSKSPRTVLLVAHEAARRALPMYAHRFAPRKFTQPQLFARLALKVHQRQVYRGVCAQLADSPDPRRAKAGKQPTKLVGYRRYGKLMLLSCCASHLILAAAATCS